MTARQITTYYTQMWNSPADLILNRTAGNRSSYAVTDGNGNWAGVDHRWTDAGLDFQPVPICGDHDHGCDSDCNQCPQRDILSA